MTAFACTTRDCEAARMAETSDEPGHCSICLADLTPVLDPRKPCPMASEHTPAPSGYVHWHEWVESKARTHEQVRCSGCGLFRVWVRVPLPAIGNRVKVSSGDYSGQHGVVAEVPTNMEGDCLKVALDDDHPRDPPAMVDRVELGGREFSWTAWER